MFGDAGHSGVFLNNALDGAGGKAAEVARSIDLAFVAAVVEEEGNEGVGAGVEVILDVFGGGGGNENWAVLAAFAADDKLAAVEVDGIAIETGEFGNTKPTGKK